MFRSLIVFGVLLLAVVAQHGPGGRFWTGRGRSRRANPIRDRCGNASANVTLGINERMVLDDLIFEASKNATREICRSNPIKQSGDSSEGESDEFNSIGPCGNPGHGGFFGRDFPGSRGFPGPRGFLGPRRFPGPRGRGRSGRRVCECRMNQTQFEEYTNQLQTFIINEAPLRIQNYTTSEAQDFVDSFITCMEATQSDENGNIIRAN